MKSFAAVFFFTIIVAAAAGQSSPDIASLLASNNVVWNSPGPTSAQSMPLGNGDIGLNVWIETNGAVDFYIGKSDAWGDNVQGDQGLMKIGGVRVSISPSPLTNGAPFSQALMLHEGEMQITEGTGSNSVSLLVWVDANNPVIHVEATGGGAPFTLNTSLNDWRLHAPNPDELVTGQTNYVGWYHRNSASDDAHVANWTFGAIIEGPGLTNTSSTNLTSGLVTNQVVSIYPLTTRTQTVSQWLAQLQAGISQLSAENLAAARVAHEVWWDAFWHRSWIFVNGDASATNTTRGYVLQRFITAAAGRGAYPIKFNGSLFVVDNPAVPYNADGRRWGGQYWFQNTRLMYWSLLESGDFDLMQPLFNMYAQLLPADAAQVTGYYSHGGAYFAETSPFWGGLSYEGTNSPANFTAHYFEGVLELSTMMLDYYDYTGDLNFVTNTLLPVASAGLDFYDQHFPLDDTGKMFLDPVNALETYWKTHDPAPDIAGLKAVLPRMLALPSNLVAATNEAKWERMLGEIPPLPVATNNGTAVLLPYTGPQTNQIENGENTQLYAIFPYRIFGVDKADLPLAIASFNARLFHGLGWADWMQDPIQAAMIGLTDVAQQYTVYAFTNTEPSLKFPAFWREQNDYMPSQDTGGVAVDALQRMLMQCEGDKIMLLPAWPAGWNASFKLSAPYQTSVQGNILNGRITNLVVTPAARMADVILMNGGGSAPSAPTNLTAVAVNGGIVVNWASTHGALSYNVKRSANSGGPYSTISNGVVVTNFTNTISANGSSYYYVVSAVNPSGESPNSVEVSAVSQFTVLGAPVGLTATAGDSQVVLEWASVTGAGSYEVRRSSASSGPFTNIANPTFTYFRDTNVINRNLYYYTISALNSLGESVNSPVVVARPMSVSNTLVFSSGVFSNDSVLALIGPPSQEVYGVSFDGSGALTTSNQYVFDAYPSSYLRYGGTGEYSTGGFLGGATSGDTAFDAVLDGAELGISSGTLTLSNLTVGETYNVLFLEADARSGVGARTFSITRGLSSSPAQSYAFVAGKPSLGGYVLDTFIAAAATQSFTNTAAGYGYQLNAVIVGKVPLQAYFIGPTLEMLDGKFVVITGAGGPPDGTYRILSSTNLAAPLSSWTPVATNRFSDAGNSAFTNPISPAAPMMFYQIVGP